MRKLLLLLIMFLPATVAGKSYPLPPQEFSLVGAITLVEALAEDTLLDIAKRHDVGQDVIILANPGVDRWLPGAGTTVVIPSRHILPS